MQTLTQNRTYSVIVSVFTDRKDRKKNPEPTMLVTQKASNDWEKDILLAGLNARYIGSPDQSPDKFLLWGVFSYIKDSEFQDKENIVAKMRGEMSLEENEKFVLVK